MRTTNLQVRMLVDVRRALRQLDQIRVLIVAMRLEGNTRALMRRYRVER